MTVYDVDLFKWRYTHVHAHTYTQTERNMKLGAVGVRGNDTVGDATVCECGRNSYSALEYINMSYFGSDDSPPLRPGSGPPPLPAPLPGMALCATE